MAASKYLADALSSSVALAEPGGNVQTEYNYEPFGRTSVSGITTNPFQYTGRENDRTGLYYYRARYYSPSLARFLSEDPLRQGLNYYAYVGNDPINRIDPLGSTIFLPRGRSIPTEWQPRLPTPPTEWQPPIPIPPTEWQPPLPTPSGTDVVFPDPPVLGGRDGKQNEGDTARNQ